MTQAVMGVGYWVKIHKRHDYCPIITGWVKFSEDTLSHQFWREIRPGGGNFWADHDVMWGQRKGRG